MFGGRYGEDVSDRGREKGRWRDGERERRLHSREEIEYRERLLIIFLCWFSCIYTLFNYINIILYYLPKTKKFGCVGRGDLTSVFF